jgi:hypothetical protein
MPAGMGRAVRRLNITLRPKVAARLAHLARLTGVPERTLAGLMLSKALEETDPNARSIVTLLDGIRGAYDHTMDSLEQAREGETIGLDDL